MGKIPSSSSTSAKESAWSEEALDLETMSRIETFVRKIEDGETRKSMLDLLVKGAKAGATPEEVEIETKTPLTS